MMKAYLFLSTAFLMGQVLSQEHSPKVKQISIRPTKLGTKIPENQNAKQCGGNGLIVQQRNALCSDPACKVTKDQLGSGKDVVLETEFIPSTSMSHLGYRISALWEGQSEPVIIFDSKISSSHVGAGSSYTIELVLDYDPGKKGKLHGKHEIYDFKNKRKTVDVCVETELHFV